MMTNSGLSNLNVWYGWAVVNKIRKKPALSVIFHNDEVVSERTLKSLKRFQTTFFVRKQTTEEALDAKNQNKIFTEYSSFVFEKPFNGNIEKLLENNYKADHNNVSEQQLIEIKNALRDGFKHVYKRVK